MERAESFEDLQVWKRARELANNIYDLTRKKNFLEDPGLTDQLRRAAVSVMSNISEGFERGSNTEFIQFLYIAKGSCGEVRCQLYVARDQKFIAERDFNSARNMARQVGGMLGNLIHYLKGSRLKGTKFKKPPVKSMAEEVKETLARLSREAGKSGKVPPGEEPEGA